MPHRDRIYSKSSADLEDVGVGEHARAHDGLVAGGHHHTGDEAIQQKRTMAYPRPGLDFTIDSLLSPLHRLRATASQESGTPASDSLPNRFISRRMSSPQLGISNPGISRISWHTYSPPMDRHDQGGHMFGWQDIRNSSPPLSERKCRLCNTSSSPAWRLPQRQSNNQQPSTLTWLCNSCGLHQTRRMRKSKQFSRSVPNIRLLNHSHQYQQRKINDLKYSYSTQYSEEHPNSPGQNVYI